MFVHTYYVYRIWQINDKRNILFTVSFITHVMKHFIFYLVWSVNKLFISYGVGWREMIETFIGDKTKQCFIYCDSMSKLLFDIDVMSSMNFVVKWELFFWFFTDFRFYPKVKYKKKNNSKEKVELKYKISKKKLSILKNWFIGKYLYIS